LAAANPAAYEPDLALSLNNLSNRLTEAGRGEETERARQEAAEQPNPCAPPRYPGDARMPAAGMLAAGRGHAATPLTFDRWAYPLAR
jgi:hypothetical protein